MRWQTRRDSLQTPIFKFKYAEIYYKYRFFEFKYTESCDKHLF